MRQNSTNEDYFYNEYENKLPRTAQFCRAPPSSVIAAREGLEEMVRSLVSAEELCRCISLTSSTITLLADLSASTVIAPEMLLTDAVAAVLMEDHPLISAHFPAPFVFAHIPHVMAELRHCNCLATIRWIECSNFGLYDEELTAGGIEPPSPFSSSAAAAPSGSTVLFRFKNDPTSKQPSMNKSQGDQEADAPAIVIPSKLLTTNWRRSFSAFERTPQLLCERANDSFAATAMLSDWSAMVEHSAPVPKSRVQLVDTRDTPPTVTLVPIEKTCKASDFRRDHVRAHSDVYLCDATGRVLRADDDIVRSIHTNLFLARTENVTTRTIEFDASALKLKQPLKLEAVTTTTIGCVLSYIQPILSLTKMVASTEKLAAYDANEADVLISPDTLWADASAKLCLCSLNAELPALRLSTGSLHVLVRPDTVASRAPALIQLGTWLVDSPPNHTLQMMLGQASSVLLKLNHGRPQELECTAGIATPNNPTVFAPFEFSACEKSVNIARALMMKTENLAPWVRCATFVPRDCDTGPVARDPGTSVPQDCTTGPVPRDPGTSVPRDCTTPCKRGDADLKLEHRKEYHLALRLPVHWRRGTSLKKKMFVWKASENTPTIGQLRNRMKVPEKALVVDATFGVVLKPEDVLCPRYHLLVVEPTTSAPSVCQVAFCGCTLQCADFYIETPLSLVWKWRRNPPSESEVLCWKEIAVAPAQGLEHIRLSSLLLPFGQTTAARPQPTDTPAKQSSSQVTDDDDGTSGLPCIPDDDEQPSHDDAPATNKYAQPTEKIDKDGKWVLPLMIRQVNELRPCRSSFSPAVHPLLPQPKGTGIGGEVVVRVAKFEFVPCNALARIAVIAFGISEDLSAMWNLKISERDGELFFDTDRDIEKYAIVTKSSQKHLLTVDVMCVADRTTEQAIEEAAQLASGVRSFL